MLAAVVGPALPLRDRIGDRKGQTTLFAVALTLANSIYFFGRSHENNLINISASLLLCAFIGIDLAIFAWDEGPRWSQRCCTRCPSSCSRT